MFEELRSKVNEMLSGSFLEPGKHKNINTVERFISIATGTFILYKGLSQMIKHPFIGLQEAAAGSFLLYRGTTGYCPIYNKLGKDTTDLPAIRITERFIVNAPRSEVYAFWRKLENLPKFMKHLHSVDETSATHSYWRANVPAELIKLSWNAEITREEQDRYIGWQSVEGSMIDNAGKVEFGDALNGEGTELNIEINYFPPAGTIGHSIAKLLNRMFEKMVHEDVTNFKHYVERDEYKQYSSHRKTAVL